MTRHRQSRQVNAHQGKTTFVKASQRFSRRVNASQRSSRKDNAHQGKSTLVKASLKLTESTLATTNAAAMMHMDGHLKTGNPNLKEEEDTEGMGETNGR